MAARKATKRTTDTNTKSDVVKTAVQTTLEIEEPKVETTEKKEEAPAKKTTKAAPKKTAKKTTAKKDAPAVKSEMFIQFQGLEFSEKEIMKKIVSAWEAEGKKASPMKRVKIYVKPEDGRAYYVINEGLKNGSTGAVEL